MKGACEISTLHESERNGNRGGITKAATGMENWFERGQLPLSFSMQENKLSYSSASNMMAIKHNTKSKPIMPRRWQPWCR